MKWQQIPDLFFWFQFRRFIYNLFQEKKVRNNWESKPMNIANEFKIFSHDEKWLEIRKL